jgi:hypothetical protein
MIDVYEAYQKRVPQNSHVSEKSWRDAKAATHAAEKHLRKYQEEFNKEPPPIPEIYNPMAPDHDLDDLHITLI